MVLTVQDLLGLIAREVQGCEMNVVRGGAEKSLRHLGTACKTLGIADKQIEIASEEAVKKSSPRKSASGSNESARTDGSGQEE